MKNIVFFGDSFAAHGRGIWHTAQMSSDFSYIDMVADAMDCQPIYMGFGGVSWWFSYRQLMTWMRANPHQWKETQALVMCLTAGTRPKVSDIEHVNRRAHDKSDHLVFYDEDFDQWTYRKFLKEIKALAHNKKIIVLPCFQTEVWISKEFKHHFSACVSNLFVISRSEYDITHRDEIFNCLRNETGKANHLNAQNNRALANELINRLQNYTPGLWQLTASDYDMKNHLFLHEWEQAAEFINRSPRQQQ